MQGDYLTGSDSVFAYSSKESPATSPHKAFNNSSKLSFSGPLRQSGLRPTQHSWLNSTAHGKTRSIQSPKAAHQVQTSPLQASSKSSRYLQRHLLPQPSALQQLQAFSERQNRGIDAAACSSSHADCSGTSTDITRSNLPQLRVKPASETLQHYTEDGSSDQGVGAFQVHPTTSEQSLYICNATIMVFLMLQQLAGCHMSAWSPAASNKGMLVQAESGGPQPGIEQGISVQLKQSLLQSHPLQESRPLSPDMPGDDVCVVPVRARKLSF